MHFLRDVEGAFFCVNAVSCNRIEESRGGRLRPPIKDTKNSKERADVLAHFSALNPPLQWIIEHRRIDILDVPIDILDVPIS